MNILKFYSSFLKSPQWTARSFALQPLPFSLAETAKVDTLFGGLPEVVLRPRGRELGFAFYLQIDAERAVSPVSPSPSGCVSSRRAASSSSPRSTSSISASASFNPPNCFRETLDWPNYLPGIQSHVELDRSPFFGSIFEGFVAYRKMGSSASA
jgi:hypothetical protein